MEENCRIVKFHGRAGEDFQLWMARTEAALLGKKAMSVVSVDVVGDGSADLEDSLRDKVSDA